MDTPSTVAGRFEKTNCVPAHLKVGNSRTCCKGTVNLGWPEPLQFVHGAWPWSSLGLCNRSPRHERPGVTPPQVERMKKLNMFVAVNPREIVSGGLLHRVWAIVRSQCRRSKEIQDSGIMWGLGTDAFEVNQYRPFQTLYWAVTGDGWRQGRQPAHGEPRSGADRAHAQQRVSVLPRE